MSIHQFKQLLLVAGLTAIPLSHVFSQSLLDYKNRYEEAVSLYDQGRYRDAKEIFIERSNSLCTKIAETERCIRLKLYLSDIEKREQNRTVAESHLMDAEEILKNRLKTPHPLQMRLYLQMVFLYSDMKKFEEGTAKTEKLLELTKYPVMKGMPSARAYLGAAYLEDRRGNLNKALRSYQQAVQIVRALEKDRESDRFLAICYNNMGIISRRFGDYLKAMDYYQKALQITESLYRSNHPDIGLLYNSIGSIHYSRGDLGQAAEYFLRSADIFKENFGEYHHRVAAAYNNAGVTFTDMNDLEGAAEILEKAQRIKVDLLGEHHIDTAIGYSNLATIYLEFGNNKEALINYHKSIQIREQIYGTHHPNLIIPYIDLGEYYIQTGDFRKARNWLDRAYRITKNRLGENHPHTWEILYQKGLSFEEELAYKSAAEYYQNSYKGIIQDNGLDSEKDVRVEHLSHPQLFMRTAAKLGDVYLKTYELERSLKSLRESIKYYNTAMSIIDYLQKSYISEASKLNLVDQNYSIYTNTIQSYSYFYKETGDSKWLVEIFKIQEQSRARIALQLLQDLEAKRFGAVPQEILDQESEVNHKITAYYLRLQEEQEKGFEANRDSLIVYRDSLFSFKIQLQNLTERLETAYPEYYQLKYDQQYADPDAVFKQLNPDEAFINYTVSDEKIYALILHRNKIGFHILGSSVSITDEIQALRHSLLSGDTEHYSDLAFKLYHQLVKPVVEGLTINSLILVPDQSLHYLPFGLLLKEKPEKYDYSTFAYLIRDYQISYVPSATLLHFMSKKRDPSPENLFAVAPFNNISKGTVSLELQHGSATRVPALPFTSYEINEIAKVFRNPETWAEYIFPEEVMVLEGRDASKETIKNFNFTNYQFVHFATHAFVNQEDPTRSGIVFWKGDADDGIIYLDEIYNMEFNADLVVLGACDTGLGTAYRGEGIIGFTRAFIYAGASNLIVSMWRVKDRATARLMIDFYRYAKSGYSYSKALQQAKLDIINKSEFSDPRNWAAFILQGR